jgi:hypothetical protein
MKKKSLQDELNREKIFVVRYAIFINLIIAIGIITLLVVLKINNQSVLKMVIEYYFKNG